MVRLIPWACCCQQAFPGDATPAAAEEAARIHPPTAASPAVASPTLGLSHAGTATASPPPATAAEHGPPPSAAEPASQSPQPASPHASSAAATTGGETSVSGAITRAKQQMPSTSATAAASTAAKGPAAAASAETLARPEQPPPSASPPGAASTADEETAASAADGGHVERTKIDGAVTASECSAAPALELTASTKERADATPQTVGGRDDARRLHEVSSGSGVQSAGKLQSAMQQELERAILAEQVSLSQGEAAYKQESNKYGVFSWFLSSLAKLAFAFSLTFWPAFVPPARTTGLASLRFSSALSHKQR